MVVYMQTESLMSDHILDYSALDVHQKTKI